MPKRPKSHVIDDKAITKVCAVIAEAGYAVEDIHKDYGEDLLVQTSLNSVVDPNKIWIQVKGTENLERFRNKKHGLHYKITQEHAMRWIRSSDLVVVILWDVTNNIGYWSKPIYNLSEWDLKSKNNKRLVLAFDESEIFTCDAMHDIGWDARIRHYQILVAGAQADYDGQPCDEKTDENVVPLICLDFLKIIGVFGPNGLEEEFWNQFIKELQLQNAILEPDEPPINAIARSAILTLLTQTQKKANRGLPTLLLKECAALMIDVVQILVDITTDRLQ